VATSGALKGLGALVVVLGGVVLAGSLLGFGPLAAPVPPDKVTDPREMIARGLQATLDATAIHLEGTIDGTIPGDLVDRGPAPVSFDGTTIAAEARPKDAKTATHVVIPGLAVALDTISVWDALWFRTEPDGPWVRASVGGVAADAGVDVNPLTLVDRLRSYLARPGLSPTASDVPCPGVAGTCRHVVLDAGNDPAALLAVMLPDEREAALPEVSTVITVDAEVATLRPVRIVLDMRSADGGVDLRVVLDASGWDDPAIVIDEPPAGS
jgi:hypothetical protein